MSGIVAEGRQMNAHGDAIGKLGKCERDSTLYTASGFHHVANAYFLHTVIKKPFAKFAPAAIIRYFLYLPLNFIPVVGTVLFVIMQGRNYGPAAHARYFQLKKWNSTQKSEWIDQHKAAYTSFGIPATLLELVPIGGILFAFTNQVGAALVNLLPLKLYSSFVADCFHSGLPTSSRAAQPHRDCRARLRRPCSESVLRPCHPNSPMRCD